ncbi:hypothetical protein [Humibacter sp.]|uniref:hypothetical protein n=1 Tax=Humibacter sp. TaxID=1940291 RepID=UPI002D183694|nr:hypothetical protein [Humibacter sp.]HVX08173.1 hypothetical protein [Humibacter sp.]
MTRSQPQTENAGLGHVASPANTSSHPEREAGTGLPPRRRGRRVVFAATGLAAAALVLGGVACATLPATAAPTVAVRSVVAPDALAAMASSGSGSGSCGGVLLVLKHDYDRLPDALRKDVASAAHQSSTSARHAALQSVLKKAYSGDYGAAVESAAHNKKTLAGVKAAWDRLPSALRDDVKKARSANGDARTADIKAIVSKAASGGYGERVKDVAAKVGDRLARCEAHAKGSTPSGTGTPGAPGTSAPGISAPAPTAPHTSAPSTSAPAPTPTTGA